ncbi:MAG: hypothetical protein HUJ26_00040 [Planctomycetaceae bacterium]|nr:hypothetical protein [Planctomycetaceae bacterium]
MKLKNQLTLLTSIVFIVQIGTVSSAEPGFNYEEILLDDIANHGLVEWEEMKEWKSTSRIRELGFQRWQDLLSMNSNPVARFVAYHLISTHSEELRPGAALLLLSGEKIYTTEKLSEEPLKQLQNLSAEDKNTLEMLTRVLDKCVDKNQRLNVGSILPHMPTEFLVEWFKHSEEKILHSTARAMVVLQLQSRVRQSKEGIENEVKTKLLKTISGFKKSDGFALCVYLTFSETEDQKFETLCEKLVTDNSIIDMEFEMALMENKNKVSSLTKLSKKAFTGETADRRKEIIQYYIERFQRK